MPIVICHTVQLFSSMNANHSPILYTVDNLQRVNDYLRDSTIELKKVKAIYRFHN